MNRATLVVPQNEARENHLFDWQNAGKHHIDMIVIFPMIYFELEIARQTLFELVHDVKDTPFCATKH